MSIDKQGGREAPVWKIWKNGCTGVAKTGKIRSIFNMPCSLKSISYIQNSIDDFDPEVDVQILPAHLSAVQLQERPVMNTGGQGDREGQGVASRV